MGDTTNSSNDPKATHPPPPPFNVIIVGGGPVGLTMAHALSAAGIDFVVLERHSTFSTLNGGSTALWPHSVRLLDQLGLLERAKELYLPMHCKSNLRPDGSVIAEQPLLDNIETIHGHPWMLFQRFTLVQLLYDNLPDKDARALTNKEVSDIELTDTGVVVRCKDGSSHVGSIVVGADGVRSVVRSIMGRLSTSSGHPLSDQTSHFSSQFRTLYGYGDPIPGIPAGCVWETRGKDTHFQLFSCADRCTFTAYVTLPEAIQGVAASGNWEGNGGGFTAEDQEAVATMLADRKIHPDLTFSDLWKLKRWSLLDNLEEGRIDTWHFGGRVVLAGDAVHKMCPEIGWGLNTGMQEVAALTNSLHSLLLLQTPHQQPSSQQLSELFASYQAERLSSAKFACFLSGMIARNTAWQSAPLEFLDRYVTPRIGGDTMLARRVCAPFISQGLVLDFVEERNRPEGQVKWKNLPKLTGQKPQQVVGVVSEA